MTPTATSEHSALCDLAVMVAENAWGAKDYAASKRAAQLAIGLNPADVDALSRLGRISLVEGDFHRAIEYFERVIDQLPSAAAAVNLAIAYGALKDFAAASGWCSLALKHDPRFLPAYIQAAALLEEQGKLYAAEQTVLGALEVFPGNPERPELVYALALYQLHRGDFENGWPNYEARAPRRELSRKLDEYQEWEGEPLEGKTILVCGEQGIGDQIMFARYVPLLVELGATVVLFTVPELARLFAGSFDRVRVLASDAELAGLEPEYWVAMGSLPLRWRQFEAIDVVGTPARDSLSLPYLWPDRAAVDRFRRMVGNGDGRLKVGLCWKGNPKHRRDEYRSMRFEDLKPLLDSFRRTSGRMCPNDQHVVDAAGACTNCAYGEFEYVDFFSLQRGDTESGLVNLTEYCHDIADTAAAIAALDLVVTVDTAMLHLAGAIGVPVWGMMYTPGDWRWGKGHRTPWYASAQLFHQTARNVWTDVVECVTFDLKAAAADYYAGPPVADDPILRVRRRRNLNVAPIDANGWSMRSKELPPVARECRYGAMTWPANDHYIGRALDFYGEYSESEAELLRKLLKPGDMVVEAGANVGGLTLALADIVGSNGVVHAFEPQPLYFSALWKNTRSRINYVLAYHAALGARTGHVTMRAVEAEKVHAPGWPSTGPEFGVSLWTIDSLALPRCALIKVDVDGPEHDILLGAESTIDRCRPLIYVEYDKPAEYPEMLGWLVAKGYRLYRHAAPLYNPRNFRGNPVNVFGSIVSLMVLAVPDERKDLHPCDWGLERIREEKE